MTGRKKLSILVADDSSVVRQLLDLWLHKICACDVETVPDGLVAIQRINRARDEGRSYDLVITDLAMPNMNGIQLVERVRKLYAPAQLPVLVLTTFAGSDYREQAGRAGASDYLTKPLRYFELLRAVRRLFPGEYDRPAPEGHPSFRTAMAG